MQPRHLSHSKRVKRVSAGMRFIVAALLAIGLTVLFIFWKNEVAYTPAPDKAEKTVSEAAVPRILDFHMFDVFDGLRLSRVGEDKAEVQETSDGGGSWQLESAGTPEEMRVLFHDRIQNKAASKSAFADIMKESRIVESASADDTVKKLQYVTQKIGWALLSEADGEKSQLWLTIDGGMTWTDKPSAETAEVMTAERERLHAMAMEGEYFADVGTAAAVMLAEYVLIPGTASPGDIVLVRSRSAGTVNWQGKDYVLKPFGIGHYAYLPVSVQIKPGSYRIGDQTLTIRPKSFETQHLKVTNEQNSMRQNTERIQADQLKINKARSESRPEFLFAPDTSFVQPVEGILTTPYGFTRYVNGSFAGSHTAIDLAAPTGTPIQATNDGVVVLAEELYLTGNSIYIDHGMQLFSQYAHLSELKVNAGDRVKKGDIIGLVGSTGFSTGPHLHFTFWAHNVPVNPNLFFGKTPFDWLSAAGK